jgi:hypothetical protein
MSVLALREARRHVRSFADESELLADHADPAQCVDCDALLQVGIDAFHWLVRADETIRLAIYRGQVAHDSLVEGALAALARAWLNTCGAANGLIALHLGQGDSLSNLAEFRRCEAEMRAMVDSWRTDEITDAIRALRDGAIEEHRRGETAEFV